MRLRSYHRPQDQVEENRHDDDENKSFRPKSGRGICKEAAVDGEEVLGGGAIEALGAVVDRSGQARSAQSGAISTASIG